MPRRVAGASSSGVAAAYSTAVEEVLDRLDEEGRLIHECHMAADGNDHQPRSGNLLIHRPGQRRVALVMISCRNQSRHANFGKALCVLDGSQVAVDYKLSA